MKYHIDGETVEGCLFPHLLEEAKAAVARCAFWAAWICSSFPVSTHIQARQLLRASKAAVAARRAPAGGSNGATDGGDSDGVPGTACGDDGAGGFEGIEMQATWRWVDETREGVRCPPPPSPPRLTRDTRDTRDTRCTSTTTARRPQHA